MGKVINLEEYKMEKEIDDLLKNNSEFYLLMSELQNELNSINQGIVIEATKIIKEYGKQMVDMVVNGSQEKEEVPKGLFTDD